MINIQLSIVKKFQNPIYIGAFVFLILFTTNFQMSYSQGSNSTSYNPPTTVQINKILSNDYNIINDQTVFIRPFFETSYVITGSSLSLNNSQGIIVSTIIDDFSQSPTYGYILSGVWHNNTASSNNNTMAFMPNPFATPESINRHLNQTLSNAISNATDLSSFDVGIKCNFGNNMTNWSCNSYATPN